MPNSDWRTEKIQHLVKALCQVLGSQETHPKTRELLHPTLWNALKLYADAVEKCEKDPPTRWSPGVVQLFIDHPGQCEKWLALMAEKDFSAEEFWGKLPREA